MQLIIDMFITIKRVMNIIDFIQQFPDENTCRVRCKKHRDKTCIMCNKCNCTGIIGTKTSFVMDLK